VAIENVTVKDASGNAQPVAADKIGPDYVQVIKIGVGADGTFTLVDEVNPLPTVSIGGATESKQDTAQASLTALVASSDATAVDADAIRLAAQSIDSKTPSLIGGESQVADAQTRARIGATTDAEATADGTVIAVLKRLRTLLGNIATSIAGTLSTEISQSTPGVSNGVQITALTYPISTANSSVAQLAAGATFTGTVETILSLQAAQIMVRCDQAYTLSIIQYIDAAGTQPISTDVFTRAAGVALNENVTLPGNYFSLTLKNEGASTTTTLALSTTFGIMDTQPRALTNAGNFPVAVRETTAATASGNITTQNLVPAGAATANSAVEITLNGASTLTIQTTGTYTGALSLQGTINGTTWVTFGGIPLLNINTGGYLATITSALQSIFQADVTGFTKARVTGLAAMTGTAAVSLSASTAPAMMALDAALPTGANVIGAVTNATAANFKAQVQPVPATSTDKSGTIATGGTAQAAIALNANRRGFYIQNLSAGVLWISDTTTAVAASPSIKIPVDGLYESMPGNCPTAAISIIGATTGQAFAAREIT